MNAWLEPGIILPAGVHVLTTVRYGLGNSAAPFDQLNLGLRCGDDIGVAQSNRQELMRALNLPSAPKWLNQVHGTDVQTFSGGAENGTEEPVADAAVTATKGVVLSVLTADCLPVALISKPGDEVAVAHAGWRGLAAGVLENTVQAMKTSPSALVAWMGPAAGPCIYEVGAEVRDAFLAADPDAGESFKATRPGHWNVDLYGLARKRLHRAGVMEVHGGDRCTISEPAFFFSHRRDARTGRMATLAWMDL